MSPVHLDLRGTRRRWFRDRRTAIAATVTIGLLTWIEAADIATPTQPDDDVRDDGTAGHFAAAMSGAILGSAITLARRRPMPDRPGAFWPGIGVIWTGVGINRIARHQLGPNYRARLTVVSQHRVVVEGLYRYVRHPMYVGSTLICVGAGIAIAAPASALWALPVLSLLHRIRIEEELLRDQLGADYADFTRRRGRLIPQIGAGALPGPDRSRSAVQRRVRQLRRLG